MSPPHERQEVLAGRAEAGDQAAFEALLERFHGQLQAWIRLGWELPSGP